MVSESQSNQASPIRILGKSFRLFLPAALIVVGGAVALFQSESNTELTKIRSSEEVAVRMGASSIRRIVQSLTSDLAYLAGQDALIDMYSDGTRGIHGRLISDWLVFSRTKKIYDQIRWIAANGEERARVNFNNGEPANVSADKLQNKRGRYYFTDAIKLNRGEFFISPLDLNIERGKIERPIKPMIRIGTPIYDGEGKKRGIVLLNYLGKRMLHEFGQVMGPKTPRAWLLNRDGYWLKGPSIGMEWGFMYKRAEASLSHQYPEAWRRITASNEGQFEDKHGLWTFGTVHPLTEGQKSSMGTHEANAPSQFALEGRDYFWKSVLLLPRDEYHSGMWRIGTKLFVVSAVLLVGLFIGAWRLAGAWVREEQIEEELRRVNLGLEDTVDERTHELRAEIAERQKVEEELREREERFRSIAKTSTVAMIVTVDHLGNVVTWNPAAENAFGYKEEEVLGRSLTDFMPERYRAAHQAGLEQAAMEKEYRIIGKTMELTGLRKNGEEFPIEMSLGTWKQGDTRYFSAVLHDITERKRTEERLKYMATHDSLTGLPTRVLCVDHIDIAMASARRNKTKMAVLFFDLDGFKEVNDTMGHDAGDNLLVGVGERLTAIIREIDTAARVGGDEFIVVLVDIEDRGGAAIVAEKLIDEISRPFTLGEKEAAIGASVGIALYPDDAQETDLILQRADSAMYAAKKGGKNRFCFWSEQRA